MPLAVVPWDRERVCVGRNVLVTRAPFTRWRGCQDRVVGAIRWPPRVLLQAGLRGIVGPNPWAGGMQQEGVGMEQNISAAEKNFAAAAEAGNVNGIMSLGMLHFAGFVHFALHSCPLTHTSFDALADPPSSLPHL